jgi:hypothetical protein
MAKPGRREPKMFKNLQNVFPPDGVEGFLDIKIEYESGILSQRSHLALFSDKHKVIVDTSFLDEVTFGK